MISHKIFSDKQYLIESVSGSFVLEAFTGYERVLVDDPAYRQGYARLYDLTGLDKLDLDTSQLVRLVETFRLWILDSEVKLALLVDETDQATARLFAAHFAGNNLRVFLRKSSAVSWLTKAETEELSEPFEGVKRIRLKGKIGIDDILSSQLTWYQDPAYMGEIPVLWDLRDATPTSSMTELQDKTRFVQASSDMAGRTGKTAILVNSHLMELLIKQMMGIVDWRKESRMFTSSDEALGWLESGETI
jgi:hypothetical protein